MLTRAALEAALGDRTLAAVQLRRGHRDYSKARRRWEETLWVELVVSAPGWHSSRYRYRTLERLDAPDFQAVRDVAARFAQDAGVPLHAAGRDEHGWIEVQPAGEALDWPVAWEAVRWRSDGLSFTHSGTEVCTERAGQAALQAAGPRVAARLLGDDPGLVRMTAHLTLDGETRQRWHRTPAVPTAGLPTAAALRKQARGGARPSEMLCPQPGTTPLALMQVLSDVFKLSLEDAAPAGAWRRGALPAAQMDPLISARIQRNEVRWGLGWLLAGAWYRKEPMRQAMLAYKAQGVSTLQMIMALREGFRFSLRHGKEIVSMCCAASYSDDTFEARFGECVAECA